MLRNASDILLYTSVLSSRRQSSMKSVGSHNEETKEERASGHVSAQSVDVTPQEQTTHQSYVSLPSTSGAKRYCENAVQFQ